VWIVGHTDNVGRFEDNLRLSEDRAKAVVAVLVSKHRIAENRVMARGVGPLSPIASNASDDGRKQNRRVEMVKQ
jgi:outer membrane protein OmpA-like peptidoglycan-associated protein